MKKIYQFLKIKKTYQEYLFLFLITGLILFIKFHTLFTSNSILPGWDTTGHYYAFLKAVEFLKHGELRGYILNWFGGLPLFYFYPPLNFWLMGSVALIFSGLSKILIFKLFIFLSLTLVPVAFNFFIHSFFPNKKINIFLILFASLIYLFYQPTEYGSIGLGITGAISAGLLVETFSFNFVLFFLGYFKRLLNEDYFSLHSPNFIGAFIFGTLIIYSHYLSIIFSALLGIIIIFFYFKKENIKKIIYLCLALLLSGAYIFYPLLTYHKFTSAWNVGISSYFSDPLLPLLGFDPSAFLRGNFINFNWLHLFIFIFFILGFIKLIRQKKFLIPSLFLISFIFIPRNFFNQIFPQLSIHYYRILPLLFLIYLSIAIFGIQEILNYFSKKNYVGINYILISLLIFILGSQIYYFSFLNSGLNYKPRLLPETNFHIEYYSDFKKYKLETAAQEVVKYFKDNKISARVVPDINRRIATVYFGSANYFNFFLPTNNTPSLFGLYAESAYQLPFIFSPLEAIEKNHLIYGKIISLMDDPHYLAQDPKNIIKELALFNTKYLIVGSKISTTELKKVPSDLLEKVEFTKNNNPLEIYKIKNNLRQYISAPQYLPALFINQDHKFSFKDFALGWYKMPDNLDYPIIFDGQKIEKINLKNIKSISLIIVQANHLKQKEIQELKNLHKKIVILACGKYQGSPLPKSFSLIEDFLPVVSYYNQAELVPPNYQALNQLNLILSKNKSKFINPLVGNQKNIQAETWKNEKISFSGQGPIIINASYFPDWRSQNSEQEVYQVTPGQILVFSQGKTTLKFSASKGEKISAWVSLGTIIIILGLSIFIKKRKKN